MDEFRVSQLYEGRPDDFDTRLEKEQDCYRLLEQLKINYWRADHDPADTVENCRAVEDVLGVSICKNLFLCNRQRTEYYLLMMPGDKPFMTKYLSQPLGIARLSFGTPDKLLELLNLTPGSVTVMGLMYDKARKVRLIIDSDIRQQEYVRCHPCINTSTLKLSQEDFSGKLLPYLGHRPTYVSLPWEDDER